MAIGTLQHPSTYSPYNTLNLEKENVTIDFSSQDNYCPDTTTTKVDTVTLIINRLAAFQKLCNTNLEEDLLGQFSISDIKKFGGDFEFLNLKLILVFQLVTSKLYLCCNNK